jgi:hypothetical protein
MTRRHTLLNRRAYTTQKVTVQCHELFCRCLSYDWGRASSGHLLHSPKGNACHPCRRPTTLRPPLPPLHITSASSPLRRKPGRAWYVIVQFKEANDVGNS